MNSKHFKCPSFQQKILDLLHPKINAVLYQTSPQEREDLKQETYLLIIKVIQTKTFKKAPSFFDLLEAEDINNNNFNLKLNN